MGPTVNMAAALGFQASVDSLLLGPRAYKHLRRKLGRDGVAPDRREVFTRQAATTAFEIAFATLLGSDEHFIRFAPPADLMMFLASQPDELFRLPPRRFEEILAELLADVGYAVELTKQTRDDGIDIVAVGRSSGLGLDERYLVQCKRNAPENRVGVAVVRELLGVGVHEPNTGLIIATTSTFTGPARKMAAIDTIRWSLHLRDYDDVLAWLRRYAAKRTGA
jgi:hypothetical protein